MRGLICIVIFFLSFSAYASSEIKKQSEEQIVHVVLIWLHEPGNVEHIEKIIQASKPLKDISGIQELRVGRSVPSDREVVDDSFDVALYIFFDSRDAMQRYLVDPIHNKAVDNAIRPLSKKIIVYDFVNTD